MGSGKTTVGRYLARLLDYRFVDADLELEERTGVDIPYIFEKEGEAGFRDREEALLDELTQASGIVLATGGGAVMRAVNRQRLVQRGLVVYLHTEVEQQWRRTRKSSHRPLLQMGNPKKKLKELMAIRDPLYREVADLVVTSRSQSARNLAARIHDTLNEMTPS